jgi:excisionase family DNA binding protein
MPEILLTQEEAAARLKISPLTLGNWLREGKIKGVKVGRLWRIREKDLDAYIESLSKENAPDG